MKRAVAVLPLLLLAACGSPAPSSPAAAPSSADPVLTSFTASGTVSAPSSEFARDDTDEDTKDVCLTDDGYDDIAYNAQVKVLDASNKTLAVGSLGSGEFSEDSRFTCAFAFTVDGVPEGEALYAVSVGGPARGSVTLKRDQMTTIALTLG